jgi:hypothetical protein
MAKHSHVEQEHQDEKRHVPDRDDMPRPTCVRVREGRTIQLGAGRVARGGEWVHVDPEELYVPSFRSAVQTEEEHGDSMKTLAQRQEEVAAAGGSSLFDAMRNVARQQQAALRERDTAARRAAAENAGMARELLDPNRPAPAERPMARELPR